jgi:beta-phosphoglucomutase-like phosphatase (HAD superfamily)
MDRPRAAVFDLDGTLVDDMRPPRAVAHPPAVAYHAALLTEEAR